MKYLLLAALCGWFSVSVAQKEVINAKRFSAVAENGTARSSAEITQNQYLEKIKGNVETMNTNMGAVVLAQTIIYQALSQVNSALKDGLAVKDITVTSADILNYLDQTLALAKADPALLLVSTQIQQELSARAVTLLSEISTFILKSDVHVLADYNARDELLKKVITQLQIIDGLAYGAWRSMFWAKERGIIASLNPFGDYISQDKDRVQQIIFNAKYLK